MKINGEFILRQVAGESILVPVGKTALSINGIITLNPVSLEIWQGVEAGADREQILQSILDKFEIDTETAAADLDEFLGQLRTNGFLID